MVRTLLAGVAGGLAFNLAMLLTFRLIGFGLDGQGFLITSAAQSAKLIAVWTSLEPLPLVVTQPAIILGGQMLFAIGHAYIYGALSVHWPAGVWPRGLRFAGLLFFMTFLYWEFFTPFNLFGEPPGLILAELGFWGLIALAEAMAIAAVTERGRSA